MTPDRILIPSIRVLIVHLDIQFVHCLHYLPDSKMDSILICIQKVIRKNGRKKEGQILERILLASISHRKWLTSHLREKEHVLS